VSAHDHDQIIDPIKNRPARDRAVSRGANRLGLGLEPCADGKTERIVAIDPGGRVARANVKVRVGDVLIDVGGYAATEAKVGLLAGNLALPAGSVSITVSSPGEQPRYIDLPSLDDASTSSSEAIDEIDDDDPLYEISAAPTTDASADPVPVQPVRETVQPAQPQRSSRNPYRAVSESNNSADWWREPEGADPYAGGR
jgi:hypothetical protein